jgi:hypothetical protein
MFEPRYQGIDNQIIILLATDNWKHVGDVKALLLPMAVTLTQFQEGKSFTSHFLIRITLNFISQQAKNTFSP